MKDFKRFLSVFMLIAMLVSVFSTSLVYVFADNSVPELTVENNIVSITCSDMISYIRYAKGEYTNATALKNAADCVTLNASAVADRSADGVFSVKVAETGTYTFWVKTTDGATALHYAEVMSIEPTISAYGVMITVDNLYGAKDFFIAKGTHDTYREVKDNLVVQVTENKLNGAIKYTYTVKDPGDYTVLVRYNDTEKENWIGYVTLEVVEPTYTEYGLQIKIENLDDIKVIRTAYGDYNTAGDIKRAEGQRSFPARTIKADPYTIQYRENGLVSVAVVYNNGYYDIYKYEVTKRVPTVVQEGNTITFGDLDELQNIRYALGEYNTSAAIKNAEGSQTIKNNAVVDGVIKVTLTEAGTYSFCVQYKDESYNYYTVTIEPEEDPDIPVDPEDPDVPVEPEIPETATATGVDVSNAFSDNMVVQRDQSLSVWGTAEGGYVFVEFAGETAIAKVEEDGTWKATFDKTFAYSTEKQDITVKSAEEDIVIKDVLIGDVYYIIGQSNVFYNVKHIIDSLAVNGETLDIDYKDTRNMRFFHISSTDYASAEGDLAQGTATVYNDVTCDAKWKTPSQIGMDVAQGKDKIFSALGYLFAYHMTNTSDVNIPIGVIEADASGMALTSFAPNHLAEKWGQETYDELGGTYHYKLAGLEQKEVKSRFVYNQQIHPMTGFSLAGMIWYQGESDHYNNRESHGLDFDAYPVMFTELMNYYRDTFGDGTYDFPVFMIELPPCYSNGGVNAFIDYGLTRAEMGTIPQLLDECYIASSSDLWFDETYWNNVHPPIKHLQSYRLYEIVLGAKYGMKNLQDVHGPVLNNVVYNENSATLTFDYVGTGLAPAHPDILGTELNGIQVRVYENGFTKWVDVTGEKIVNGNQIVINHTRKIYGVRYNAQVENHFPYRVNLCNGYGMPAIAFVDYCSDPLPEFNPNEVVGTATNVTVSSAFTSNMIVQRDERLRVWGTADASSGVVRVDFAGEIAVANVDVNGNWEATFDKTFSYTTVGQPMTITGANFTKTLNDVLIGDVYYVIGQSNVFYSLAEQYLDLKMNNQLGQLQFDFNDSRNMRFFRISNTDYLTMTGAAAQGTSTVYTDVYHGKPWMKPSDIGAQIAPYYNYTPTSVMYDRTTLGMQCFSALGYLFAYNMTNETDVPCGVIEIDASGHVLMTFTPNELADKWGDDVMNPSTGIHTYNLNGIIANTDMRTRYAYNQQIAPLSKFSIAGVIWYQGESDMSNIREIFGNEYDSAFSDQFAELMTYYRNHFGNNDFPVYIFEFPANYDDSGTPAYMDIGGVRAELGTIPQKLDNCHIISSSDLWYDTMWYNNIHPYIKHHNAARLANAVLANQFGRMPTAQAEGPVLEKVTYYGEHKAYLTFKNEGAGLTTADATGTVKGLEICVLYNGQGVWLPHEGKIITATNQITIDAGTFKLLGVRYNRQVEAYYPGTVNLCNSYGVPAIAFVDYLYSGSVVVEVPETQSATINELETEEIIMFSQELVSGDKKKA